MARGRVIRPDFWTDENVLGLSSWARLFYVGLWNFAYCDKGHLPDESFGLKLKILPNDPVNHKEIMGELMDSGRVVRLEIDGNAFLHMPAFEKHQTEDKRWKTRCPACTLANSSELSETQRSFAEHVETPPNSQLRGEERREPERTEEDKNPLSEPDGSDADVFSEEVHYLCNLLGDLVRANGNRVGKIGPVWLKAADRLIRLDGYTAQQVEWVMRWSQAHEFWQGNIMSMPKLREKFDQLKTRALAEKAQAQPKQTAAQRNLSTVEYFAQQEAQLEIQS